MGHDLVTACNGEEGTILEMNIHVGKYKQVDWVPPMYNQVKIIALHL